MAKKKAINPFYVLLVLAGLAFFVTATAYGLMTLFAVQAGAGVQIAATEHPLFTLMRRHGDMLLLGELGILALCTFGAIATDEFWTRRAARETADENQSGEATGKTT